MYFFGGPGHDELRNSYLFEDPYRRDDRLLDVAGDLFVDGEYGGGGFWIQELFVGGNLTIYDGGDVKFRAIFGDGSIAGDTEIKIDGHAEVNIGRANLVAPMTTCFFQGSVGITISSGVADVFIDNSEIAEELFIQTGGQADNVRLEDIVHVARIDIFTNDGPDDVYFENIVVADRLHINTGRHADTVDFNYPFGTESRVEGQASFSLGRGADTLRGRALTARWDSLAIGGQGHDTIYRYSYTPLGLEIGAIQFEVDE